MVKMDGVVMAMLLRCEKSTKRACVIRAKEIAQVLFLGANELEKQVLDAYQKQLPRQQCTHTS